MENNHIETAFNAQVNKHLTYSIIIDIIGMGSFLIPALAEISDIIIAPISAIAIFAIYKTPVGAIAGFVEEILPATDIIPTATIVWYYKYKMNRIQAIEEFKNNNPNLLN